MKRIMLKVAYDGTYYHGWQAQKSNSKTIEGELNKALSRLLQKPIEQKRSFYLNGNKKP